MFFFCFDMDIYSTIFWFNRGFLWVCVFKRNIFRKRFTIIIIGTGNLAKFLCHTIGAYDGAHSKGHKNLFRE